MGSGPRPYHPDDYTGNVGASSGVAAGSDAIGAVSSYNKASGGQISKKLRSLLSGSGSGGGGGGGVTAVADAGGAAEDVPILHRGGKVRKTGLARLKKGEVVLTAAQVKTLKRTKKRKGARGARR
jgi:hypothetical protein